MKSKDLPFIALKGGTGVPVRLWISDDAATLTFGTPPAPLTLEEIDAINKPSRAADKLRGVPNRFIDEGTRQQLIVYADRGGDCYAYGYGDGRCVLWLNGARLLLYGTEMGITRASRSLTPPAVPA